MKCPYCNDDMKYGVIQSPHEINWKPKKAKFFGAAAFHRDAIILSEVSFLYGSCVVAYRCTRCRKIIIDYNTIIEKQEGL
jgi:DNA-directed RNA polymerase subunit RPC12/RpoP